MADSTRAMAASLPSLIWSHISSFDVLLFRYWDQRVISAASGSDDRVLAASVPSAPRSTDAKTS